MDIEVDGAAAGDVGGAAAEHRVFEPVLLRVGGKGRFQLFDVEIKGLKAWLPCHIERELAVAGLRFLVTDHGDPLEGDAENAAVRGRARAKSRVGEGNAAVREMHADAGRLGDRVE